MINTTENVKRYYNNNTNSHFLGTSALSDDKEDQFYDTTILVISENPTYIQDGVPLYTGRVSWSKSDNCVYIDRNGKINSPRAQNYKEVLLEIDMEKFMNDNSYRYALLTSLLDQKRVRQRLAWGLEDSPEKPCGNYMGGIYFNTHTKLYAKYDRPDIAKEVHYSPTAINRRKAYKESLINSNEAEYRRIMEQVDALLVKAKEYEKKIQQLKEDLEGDKASSAESGSKTPASPNDSFTPEGDIR